MSDMLPHSLWMGYFLEYQGYVVKDSVLYQDNQSAIKLEKIVGICVREMRDISRLDIFL